MSVRIDGELDFLFSEAEITGSCVPARGRSLHAALKRRTSKGAAIRVAPGLYVRSAYWRALDWRARMLHMLRGLSELHSTWVFCFFSAAVVHGLEVSHILPLEAHVASGHARRRGNIVYHVMKRPDVCEVDGIKVTSLPQTVLDCTRYLSFPLALAVADSALRADGGTGDALAQVISHACTGQSGIERSRVIARLADGKSENGGESYARAIMLEHGVMPPELQVEYADPFSPSGSFRTDFTWRCLPTGDVAGELDGACKSEDPAILQGRSARDVLRAERLRESRLTALGLKVARFSFAQARNVYPLLDILDGFGVPRDVRHAVDIPDACPIAGDTRYGWIR